MPSRPRFAPAAGKIGGQVPLVGRGQRRRGGRVVVAQHAQAADHAVAVVRARGDVDRGRRPLGARQPFGVGRCRCRPGSAAPCRWSSRRRSSPTRSSRSRAGSRATDGSFCTPHSTSLVPPAGGWYDEIGEVVRELAHAVDGDDGVAGGPGLQRDATALPAASGRAAAAAGRRCRRCCRRSRRPCCRPMLPPVRRGVPARAGVAARRRVRPRPPVPPPPSQAPQPPPAPAAPAEPVPAEPRVRVRATVRATHRRTRGRARSPPATDGRNESPGVP